VRRLAIALVHHPVLDAQGGTVTSAITNLDVHDLARSARTYGCSDYFVTHPIAAQRELVGRILAHWKEGSSGKRIPARKDALAVVRVVESLDAAFEALGGRAGVEVWVTAARDVGQAIGFAEGRARLEGEGKPVLIVFGTGWGLSSETIAAADALLEPIRAVAGEYNHLSVRAACAIALDRLCGERGR
jgi:hypothetical protein